MSILYPPTDVLARPGNIQVGEPPRVGIYRVFDENRKPLGLAHWAGTAWGPSTFDRQAVVAAVNKRTKKLRYQFWAHYRPRRAQSVPFEIVRVRGDVTQVLATPTAFGPRGIILEPHRRAGEKAGLPVYCYVPPLVAQQAEVLAPDGAYEVIAQALLEPPRQWRGKVGEGFVWLEAIHLEPILRRHRAPTQANFELEDSCLTLSSPGQLLTLSREATSVLKQLIGG